jgi:hypothetical protein
MHAIGRLMLAIMVLFLAPPGLAEEQRFEAVGTVGVRKGQVATRATRDAAVNEALSEAVLRVARQLLIDAAVPQEFDDAALEGALGSQALPYTNRYRIVDDKGERPALFGEDRDVVSEYVVVVEVTVEAERVEQRLVEAGLLAGGDDTGETSRIRVEIRGLLHYPGYLAIRDLISAESGAVAVHPIAFARGRAVVDVELAGVVEDGEREALARRLVRAGPPALAIESVRVGDDAIVLAAQWTQPKVSEPDDSP